MQFPIPKGFSDTVICGLCGGDIETLPSCPDQPDQVVCVNCENTATVHNARSSVQRFAKNEYVRQLYMEAIRKIRPQEPNHERVDLSDYERFPFVLKPERFRDAVQHASRRRHRGAAKLTLLEPQDPKE